MKLLTNDIIVIDSGDAYIYTEGKIAYGVADWLDLADYHDDLTPMYKASPEIMRVYRPYNRTPWSLDHVHYLTGTIVYKKQTAMTIAEIEDELGVTNLVIKRTYDEFLDGAFVIRCNSDEKPRFFAILKDLDMEVNPEIAHFDWFQAINGYLYAVSDAFLLKGGAELVRFKDMEVPE